MKILKFLLVALGGLLVVAGAVAAYVAATFDPNQHKGRIIQAVKERTGRTLRLDGDIRLSFWPGIGAQVGKASLSERASEREFAAVESARVSLKLLPLLSKQAIVDTVRIKGLRATLVRARDGTTNADDLAGAPAPKQPAGAPGAGRDFQVDIAGIEIEDATLHYADQAAGTRVALSGFNFKTGRVAPGVPVRIELSTRVQSDKPRVDLRASLATRLTFDPGRSLALDELALETKGAAAGLTNLALKATGGMKAGMQSGEFTANGLSVSFTGNSGKDAIDVRLDAPRLSLTADKASGDKVSVTAKIAGPGGATQASLVLPGVEGNAQAFRSGVAMLDLDVKRGELALQAKLSSPLSGSVKARQLSLPQLKASLTASGPELPGKRLAGELAGSASVDGARELAQAALSGKIGDSNVKAMLGVADFSPVTVNFNVDIDQLDVDRYLPPKPGAGAAGGAGQTKSKPADTPFDVTALRGLNGNGTLHVGALKANNVKASDVRLKARVAAGRLDVSPLTASFYQGKLASSIAINAAPAVPTFAVKHAMTGVNVGPFLRDLANNDTLEGRGNVTVDVTTQGNSVSALKKALNGNAAVKLADGAVKGIDIAGSIRSAKARLGTLRGEQSQPADASQRTDFSELTATFNIANGVARNNDLSLKSPVLRVGGEGAIDIGGDTVNYLVKATIVGTTKGQGGRDTDELKGLTVPVRVAGPLAAPSYKLDFTAMATGAAKQEAKRALKDALQQRLGGGAPKDAAAKDPAQPGGSTRDRLKGLFGR